MLIPISVSRTVVGSFDLFLTYESGTSRLPHTDACMSNPSNSSTLVEMQLYLPHSNLVLLLYYTNLSHLQHNPHALGGTLHIPHSK